MSVTNDAPFTLDNPGGYRPVWDRPADKVRDDLDTKINRVRANKDLTPEAKRIQIARHYSDAKTAIDAMAASKPNETAAQVAAAKRAAFGIDDLVSGASPAERATMAMSYRDAQQRAAQITNPAEALHLMGIAEQSGDELLVRAIGNASLQGFGMSEVADHYLAQRPAQAEALQRVHDLQRPPSLATMLEHVVPKPAEVSNLDDGQIAQIAAGTHWTQGTV